jgi:SAM-dependent methyltransferase
VPDPPLDVTSSFVLEFARRFAKTAILDFGCGGGKVVLAARNAGLNMVGADVFYSGSNARTEAQASGLLGSAIFEIREGRLPFADSSFGLVVNNQVMEHVADLDATLAEIHRVLAPGGTLLSIFPSRDVWREGHIGIPFSHRLPRGRLRLLYTWTLRSLGLGYWKEQAPTRRQWALDKLQWIDTFTHYRPRREIFAAYDRYFRNELREPDYIRYRLDSPVAGLLRIPGAEACAAALFRKLAFLVIVSRKDTA